MLFYAIILITGGAILALELLASRIMTPYFGVSLYIWAGILSITLTSLALGYWAGGRLAAGRANKQPARERLCYWFLVMPAGAALALIAACFAYPVLFPVLARYDIVSGAFLGCLVLLFVPLLATSAMNPLLVAIRLSAASAARSGGDAGAGHVFFISTIGSVLGVFVTAFGLIPHLPNFTSLLVVAAVLAALPVIAALAMPSVLTGRAPVLTTASIALLLALGLMWKSDAYVGRMWPVSFGGSVWRLEGSASSLFGTVKVLRSEPIDAQGRFVRVYFQDGLIQNRVVSDGVSLSMYTHALELLARAYQPDMRSALTLGLGAGVVPMRLARQGVAVDAVEINPASLRVAENYFGFDRRRVTTHLGDARTFLRGCGKRYDVVVVDLFHGDGVPDYLITREFFHDLKSCVAARGIVVFNTFADLTHPRAYAHFLTTLRTEFPSLVLYRTSDIGATHVNSYVVAAAHPLAEPLPVPLDDVPPNVAPMLAEILANPRPIDRELLQYGVVITDAYNPVVQDLAAVQLTYRESIVENLPAAFFLN